MIKTALVTIVMTAQIKEITHQTIIVVQKIIAQTKIILQMVIKSHQIIIHQMHH
nr:hypothetical protein [uncultured Terrisporobacter sp.]